MRTFYIFRINKILNPLYEKKSNNIFNMLNKIYNLDKKEYSYAKRLYSRIIIPIDKNKLNNYLLMNHMNDFYYTKINNVHELSSDKEISKLIVYNSFIKINTNVNISSFFKDICTLGDDYFVIDFKNRDYFYLEDLKIKLLV